MFIKKTIAVLLAFVLLSSFSVSAFAINLEGYETWEENAENRR